MYGPTGCGKTKMAKAFAWMSKMQHISIKGTELFSSLFGESEAGVRRLFARARKMAPCVVLIDEIDVLGAARDSDGDSSALHQRMLSQMLNEMDGVEAKKKILVVGCTNQPHKLDSALLRPGRLDRLIYVPPPSFQERMEIAGLLARKIPFSPKVSLQKIAELTEGMSGACVVTLCREAAFLALKEDDSGRAKVNESHIEQANTNLIINSKFSSYKPFKEEDLDIFKQFSGDKK